MGDVRVCICCSSVILSEWSRLGGMYVWTRHTSPQSLHYSGEMSHRSTSALRGNRKHLLILKTDVWKTDLNLQRSFFLSLFSTISVKLFILKYSTFYIFNEIFWSCADTCLFPFLQKTFSTYSYRLHNQLPVIMSVFTSRYDADEWSKGLNSSDQTLQWIVFWYIYCLMKVWFVLCICKKARILGKGM